VTNYRNGPQRTAADRNEYILYNTTNRRVNFISVVQVYMGLPKKRGSVPIRRNLTRENPNPYPNPNPKR